MLKGKKENKRKDFAKGCWKKIEKRRKKQAK